MSAFSEMLYSTPPPPPAATPAPAPAPIVISSPNQAPAQAAAPAAATSPAPAPASADAPAPVVVEFTVDGIKAGIPEDVLKARSEPSRRMYGADAALAEAFPDDMLVPEGTSPDVQAAMASEVRAIAADVGLNAEDFATIREAVQAERATPMPEDQRLEAREQIVEAMNNKFGQGAYQAWLDVRKFVALDPRRAALVQEAGDHPATVLRLVDLAQAAKRAGRLR